MREASEEFRTSGGGGRRPSASRKPVRRRPSDAKRAEKTRARDFRAGAARESREIDATLKKFEAKESRRVRAEMGELMKRIPRAMKEFVNPDPSTAEDRSDARGGQKRPPSAAEGSADRVSALTQGATRDDMREGDVADLVATINWVQRNAAAARDRRSDLMRIINDGKSEISAKLYADQVDRIVRGLRIRLSDLNVSLDSAESRDVGFEYTRSRRGSSARMSSVGSRGRLRG